jgi:hypothetical protein
MAISATRSGAESFRTVIEARLGRRMGGEIGRLRWYASVKPRRKDGWLAIFEHHQEGDA